MSITGCALTKEEVVNIRQARNSCEAVNVDKRTQEISITPSIEKKKIFEQTFKIPVRKQSDEEVYDALLRQNLCLMNRLAVDFPPSKIIQWEDEVDRAFNNWPADFNSTPKLLKENLTKSKQDHFRDIDAKFTNNKYAAMKHAIFKYAIPRQDFMRIRSFEGKLKLSEGAEIKDKNVENSVAEYKTAGSGISDDIRPALQAMRPALAIYAEGRGGDQDVIKQILSSIYDAGARRITSLTPKATDKADQKDTSKVDAAK